MTTKQTQSGRDLLLSLLKARSAAVHRAAVGRPEREYWAAYVDGVDAAIFAAFGLTAVEVEALFDWRRLHQQQVLF